MSVAASMRDVTAANVVVTGTVRFLADRVALTSSAIRSTFPLESFMPIMFGCIRQFGDHLNRQVICGAAGYAVKHHRQRRTVCHRLVVSQHLPVAHLLAVVMRRPYQDRVVLLFGRKLSQS